MKLREIMCEIAQKVGPKHAAIFNAVCAEMVADEKDFDEVEYLVLFTHQQFGARYRLVWSERLAFTHACEYGRECTVLKIDPKEDPGFQVKRMC